MVSPPGVRDAAQATSEPSTWRRRRTRVRRYAVLLHPICVDLPRNARPRRRSGGLVSDLLVIRVVPATHRMAVGRMRMPGDAPAAMDVAVVRSPPHQNEAEEGHLADVGADTAPELVTVARQDVHEVGVEPVRHRWQSEYRVSRPGASFLLDRVGERLRPCRAAAGGRSGGSDPPSHRCEPAPCRAYAVRVIPPGRSTRL
jgi:hypothetical protein